jgi:hypothetical protein
MELALFNLCPFEDTIELIIKIIINIQSRI